MADPSSAVTFHPHPLMAKPQRWKRMLEGDPGFDCRERHWTEKRARLIQRNIFKPGSRPYMYTTAKKMIEFNKTLTELIKKEQDAWKLCEFCGKTPRLVTPIEEPREDLPPAIVWLGEQKQLELHWTCIDCADTYAAKRASVKL